MNYEFNEIIGVPAGIRNDQLQRPPSRQKEPNQALGLEDPRPKTRGGGSGVGGQLYGASY